MIMIYESEIKMKLRIAVCDDEKVFLEKIKGKIQDNIKDAYECNIITFNNSAELIANLTAESIDAVFLDIDMPKIDGFETAALLQKIKQNILIIFVTSHDDMVYHAWDFQPFWFIRKSHLNDLRTIMPRLFQKIKYNREQERFLFNLVAENYVIEIDMNTITYIESIKNDIFINSNINQPVKVRCKLSDAECQLYPFHIIRIQNGILINCRFISKVTSREVLLTNGMKFNISRDRVAYVKNEFQKFVRSR